MISWTSLRYGNFRKNQSFSIFPIVVRIQNHCRKKVLPVLHRGKNVKCTSWMRRKKGVAFLKTGRRPGLLICTLWVTQRFCVHHKRQSDRPHGSAPFHAVMTVIQEAVTGDCPVSTFFCSERGLRGAVRIEDAYEYGLIHYVPRGSTMLPARCPGNYGNCRTATVGQFMRSLKSQSTAIYSRERLSQWPRDKGSLFLASLASRTPTYVAWQSRAQKKMRDEEISPSEGWIVSCAPSALQRFVRL